MREHTYLPAMMGFVRNHVAQHFHADRDRKLEAARQQRQIRRQWPREKAKTLVSGRFRVTDEVDYFRMARKYYRSRSREP